MKRIFSGCQPTGNLHLGNYLGAIREFTRIPNGYEGLFCVVDLHAITVKQAPDELRANINTLIATYLAVGIDPKSIFVQSRVPAHAELGWILQCVARVGWMDRMTQFREKTGAGTIDSAVMERLRSTNYTTDDLQHLLDHVDTKRTHREKASVGLYTYPVLQAADILLYQADRVPVGDDQAQHINLTADIAEKFNHDYGEVFTIPRPDLRPVGRIMDLKTGKHKMSKSSEDDSSRINLSDTDDIIAKKIRKATAHTNPIPCSVEELSDMPTVANLLGIMAAIQETDLVSLLLQYQGQGYGVFKKDLTDVLINEIGPIRDRINQYSKEDIETGEEYASEVAEATLKKVKLAMGLL